MAPRLINRHPSRSAAIILAALPFIFLALVYLSASDSRHAANPNDKLLPTLEQMGDAIDRYAFKEDPRTGHVLLWRDTAISLQRLTLGIVIATFISLSFGVAVGLIPGLRAIFSPFITTVAMIPPLAVLPILFIVAGLGETAKVTLIAIGIGPYLMRDIALHVAAIPVEQLIKAQSLGANTWQIVWRVVLPQTWPRLLDGIRLSTGTAWLFLIASEAIAAQSGLGYRIFLVRRYLAMDVILPYVAWITILAIAFDLALRLLHMWLFPWIRSRNGGPR